MYTVSALWATLVATDGHYFITKVSINGTEYTQDKIMSMSVDLRMFSGSQPGVGGCLSGELELKMLAPSAAIPRMAEIVPYVQVTDGTQYSEWIPQGHYFVDTRETTKNDDNLPITTLHAYDAMLKTEQAYPDTAGGFPKTDADVVDEVAAAIGVGVDSRTYDLMTAGYMIGLPVGFAMREVLSNIAAMYAGNWVMNYDGELLLVAVNGIPVETNYLVDAVGDAITFGTGAEQKSESGSIVAFNDGNGSSLDALSIGINPVQDLNGYDNPWYPGGGANKLPPMVDGTYEGNGAKAVVVNGVATLSGTTTSSGNAFIIPLSASYTIQSGDYYHMLNSAANGSLAPSVENATNPGGGFAYAASPTNRIVAVPSAKAGYEVTRIRFYIANGVTISGTYSPMICSDNTVRSYTPYSNICPITGFSTANIHVSPTIDPDDGTTYSIDLDGTRYGGTLNILDGEMTVTMANIASYAGETLSGEWISDRDAYVPGATPTTGAQIVYNLSAPQTVQISPTQVSTLIGTNNIWSDTNGSTSLTYTTGGEVTRILV